jgi:3-oxoadipate enol-lactonase
VSKIQTAQWRLQSFCFSPSADQGRPVCSCTRLMVTGEMFQIVIEPLAIRHRVIVPDLRGHRRSRGLPPPHTVAQLASDLSRLLDYLGVYSIAVLGYSQGGAVAQELVLDYSRRRDGLVPVCTYAFNMTTFREKTEGHRFSFMSSA